MANDSRWSQERIDPERCGRVAQFLRTSSNVLAGYTEQDPWWEGADSSLAIAECAAAKGRGGDSYVIGLRSAYTVMHVSLFAVVQHFQSIATLFEKSDPPAESITVLARSIIEISARAWWLADLSISWEGRLARAYVEKLASAQEMARFEKSAGRKPGELAVQTIEELKNEIASFGFECNVQTLRVHGQIRPSATQLLADLMEKDMPGSNKNIYRLMSAVTHGTLWGLMLHFVGGEPDEMQRQSATYLPTQNWLDGPACTASLALGWTVERICDLLGWNRQPVESFLRGSDELFGGEFGEDPV